MLLYKIEFMYIVIANIIVVIILNKLFYLIIINYNYICYNNQIALTNGFQYVYEKSIFISFFVFKKKTDVETILLICTGPYKLVKFNSKLANIVRCRLKLWGSLHQIG